MLLIALISDFPKGLAGWFSLVPMPRKLAWWGCKPAPCLPSSPDLSLQAGPARCKVHAAAKAEAQKHQIKLMGQRSVSEKWHVLSPTGRSSWALF